MTENILNGNVSLETLLEVISLLGTAEKRRLWEFLDAELFQDEEEDPDSDLDVMTDIQTARSEYQTGDYLTLDQYMSQREKLSS
ncbi:MAG TPA: hypothetical protein V6C78_30880 [Crinalium sp.]|jgi:hypothetical protein